MEENQTFINNDIIQPEPNRKENLSFSIIDCVFAYVMLVIGYCFIRFAVYNVTGIFTTIFFIGTSFACLFYLKKNNYKLYKNHIIMFGLIITFSFVFSITANNFIKFLTILFLLILGIYWVFSICKESKKINRFFFFDLLKAIFIMPFSSFGKALKVITYSTNKSKSGNNIKLVIMGLVVTLPFTMVIALLLTRADSGLEKILGVLFGNAIEFGFISVIQFSIGIPVAFYIFGMLYSNVKKLNTNILTEKECEGKLESIKVFPNLLLYSAVMPIFILYVMFFVSQIQYFISAFSGVLPKAYSYAEYARRGFFELFAIAIINMIILMILNFLSMQTGENKPILLKVYSILLSVSTIFMIATALSKMILYISNYGLTQLRVYTSLFMLLLMIVNILIIIKQLKVNFNFITYVLLISVLFFGVLCFSNVDGNIAKFNIKMYQSGYLKELDIHTLCNLSDDALVYVLEEGINTQDYLDEKLEIYHNYPYFTYNLSSFRVKMLLEKK